MFIAIIPVMRAQFGQCRCKSMDGVIGKMWVGDMALNPFDTLPSTERSASAYLDGIAKAVFARGLTNQAPINGLVSRFQLFHHFQCALD